MMLGHILKNKETNQHKKYPAHALLFGFFYFFIFLYVYGFVLQLLSPKILKVIYYIGYFAPGSGKYVHNGFMGFFSLLSLPIFLLIMKVYLKKFPYKEPKATKNITWPQIIGGVIIGTLIGIALPILIINLLIGSNNL